MMYASRSATSAHWSSCELAGVRVDRIMLQDALAVIENYVESRKPHQIVTVNIDFLHIAQTNTRFRSVLNSSDLSLADGAPLLWLSRLRGRPIPERVTGVDLIAKLAGLAAARGYGMFLLGSTPGVAASAAERLMESFPGLRKPESYSPPVGVWDSEEQEAIFQRIERASPNILLVALGAPRQDIWLSDNLRRLGVSVCVGVGGSFEILAGQIPRAPQWMQHHGLEWAHRLRCEPRRLWKRYLVSDLPFLLREASGFGRATSAQP